MRWIRSATLALAMQVTAGCSNDEPTGHEHSGAHEYRIIADGLEVTGHLPLNTGIASRVVFLLLDEHDEVITATDHFQLTLTWDATDLASAVAVPGTTTSFDITTTRPANTDGFMTLSVYHPHTQVTRTFEPLPVLVH